MSLQAAWHSRDDSRSFSDLSLQAAWPGWEDSRSTCPPYKYSFSTGAWVRIVMLVAAYSLDINWIVSSVTRILITQSSIPAYESALGMSRCCCTPQHFQPGLCLWPPLLSTRSESMLPPHLLIYKTRQHLGPGSRRFEYTLVFLYIYIYWTSNRCIYASMLAHTCVCMISSCFSLKSQLSHLLCFVFM